MKLTILGNYGPYPPAGGSCSGYLLEHDGCSVLLECGNGVLSNLQYYLEIRELSAVIISHLHSDHVSDLYILRYAWQMEMEKDPSLPPLPVYAPGSPEGEYARIPYKNVLQPAMLCGDRDIQLGPLNFSFLQTRHSVPCYAVSIEIEGKRHLVYSADTEYFSELIPFSHGAPLILCEASYLEEDLRRGATNHMSAQQAGSLAREAGARTLVLTHLPPFRDGVLHLGEAQKAFPGAVLAEQGQSYLCDGSSEEVISQANWTQLSVETDPIVLSLIEGRLRVEGIPVMSSGEAVGGIYGLTTGPLAEKRILVPGDRLDDAKRVLQEIESYEPEDQQ